MESRGVRSVRLRGCRHARGVRISAPQTTMAPQLFFEKCRDFAVRYFFAAIRFCAHNVFRLCHWGRKRSVPPTTVPLLLRSATSLAADIRQGKVRSEEVVLSYIRRIEEVEPFINATAHARFGDALAEARAVDAAVQSGALTPEQLAATRPLLGVPVTIKSLLGVKGLPCSSGSLLFDGVLAAEDAEVVRLLRDAGAVLLATTNTAEFGMGFESCNRVYGKTRNPFDTTKTSGGSSGGEGALVGAAGSLLGIGNDLAGSIRLPCFYNGLFGHKPTRGAVSNAGVFPVPDARIHDYLSTGPMCRYAADLLTAMRVLNAGAPTPLRLDAAVDFRKVKIYFKKSFDDIAAVPKLNSQYASRFDEVLDYFRNTHGSEVRELTTPDLRQTPAIVIHALVSANSDITTTFTGGKGGVSRTRELIKYFVGLSRFTFGPLVAMNAVDVPLFYRASRVEHYEAKAREIGAELGRLLGDGAVLLLPTFPQTAPFHHETLFLLWGTCYTALFNVLGLPATQCTTGRDGQGMPLGLQVVGRAGADALTMAFAVELERAFGGWSQPGATVV